MKLTIPELISNIELNDFKVRNALLDIEKKEFKLLLEGGYWLEDSVAKPKAMEGGGIIRAYNYTSFEARYFLPQSKLWHTLDYTNLEIMDEVNIKTYENSILTLAGSGRKSGYWIEFLIDEGEIEIIFEE